MNDDLKREIILDNYQEPYNKGLVNDDSYLKTNTRSESCIDNLDFEIKIVDNIIKDIRFDGEACAISTSSSSILIKELIGKNVDDAKNILINYKNMINEIPYDEDIIGELIVYNEIYKQPNRKNCALLPSVALDNLINSLKNN